MSTDKELQALADKASKAHGIRCDKNGQFHDPPEIEAFDKVSIDAVPRLLKRIADLREFIEALPCDCDRSNFVQTSAHRENCLIRSATTALAVDDAAQGE